MPDCSPVTKTIQVHLAGVLAGHNHSCRVVSPDELPFLVPFSYYGAIKYNGSYKSQANKTRIAESGAAANATATCHLPLASNSITRGASITLCVADAAHAPAIETLTPTMTGSGFSWGVGGVSNLSVCVCATAQIASTRHSYTCHAAGCPPTPRPLPCYPLPTPAHTPPQLLPQLALCAHSRSPTDVRAYYCKLNSITSDSRQIEVEIEIFFGQKAKAQRKNLIKMRNTLGLLLLCAHPPPQLRRLPLLLLQQQQLIHLKTLCAAQSRKCCSPENVSGSL